MLHELLLTLSGHASPLLSTDDRFEYGHALGQLVSPPERVLIKSIARLGQVQANIRLQASSVTTSHRSLVCRAVAAAINDIHLARFQSQVLDVEKKILGKDAYFVGAYNSVPLSAVCCNFDGWTRVLEWLHGLVVFVNAADEGSRGSEQSSRTAAQLIARLRSELKTGYPDLEKIALQLTTTAEATWLRQASSWLLHGILPTLGEEDFFIRKVQITDQRGRAVFGVQKDLLPLFVDAEAAHEALVLGKALKYINQNGTRPSTKKSRVEVGSIAVEHHGQLSSLQYPISTSVFQRTLSTMRKNLSQRVLQQILPISQLRLTLKVLGNFFLLAQGKFAMALNVASDNYLMRQYSAVSNELRGKETSRTVGAGLTQGEVTSVLNEAWVILASIRNTLEDSGDDGLETARDTLRLSSQSSSLQDLDHTIHQDKGLYVPGKVERLFQDALLPYPTFLTIAIPDPIDLFLPPSDVHVYSVIHNYLISISATHFRFSQLWKLTILRRVPLSTTKQAAGIAGGSGTSERRAWRSSRMWSTASSVVFVTGNLWCYFQGQVKRHAQAMEGANDRSGQISRSKQADAPRQRMRDGYQNGHSASMPGSDQDTTIHDPETLSKIHAASLQVLVDALLLTDAAFTAALRAFFLKCSHLRALIQRLAAVRQVAQAMPGSASDAIDGGSPDESNNEIELHTALDEATKGVDAAMRTVTTRLVEIDRDGLTLIKGTNDKKRDEIVHDEQAEIMYTGCFDGGGNRNLSLSSKEQRGDRHNSQDGLEELLLRLNLSRYEVG